MTTSSHRLTRQPASLGQLIRFHKVAWRPRRTELGRDIRSVPVAFQFLPTPALSARDHRSKPASDLGSLELASTGKQCTQIRDIITYITVMYYGYFSAGIITQRHRFCNTEQKHSVRFSKPVNRCVASIAAPTLVCMKQAMYRKSNLPFTMYKNNA